MHMRLCEMMDKSGCTICALIQRLFPLLHEFCRCRFDRCLVPGCREIREHLSYPGMILDGSHNQHQYHHHQHHHYQLSPASINSRHEVLLPDNKQQHKAWHSMKDVPTRASMMERIVVLLHDDRPNATPDWQEKLPHFANLFDDDLYMQAETLAAYSDPLTLINRLQQLTLCYKQVLLLADVLLHYLKCKDQTCAVCGPVEDGTGGKIEKRSIAPRKSRKKKAKTSKRVTVAKAKTRGKKDYHASIDHKAILPEIQSTEEGELPLSQDIQSTEDTIQVIPDHLHIEEASFDPNDVRTWSEDMVDAMIDADALDYFAFAVDGGMLTYEQCDRILAMDKAKLRRQEQNLIAIGDEIDLDFGGTTF